MNPEPGIQHVAEVVPIWAVDLQVKIARLEVKMNIIAFLAAAAVTIGLADMVRLMVR